MRNFADGFFVLLAIARWLLKQFTINFSASHKEKATKNIVHNEIELNWVNFKMIVIDVTGSREKQQIPYKCQTFFSKALSFRQKKNNKMPK